MTRLISSIERNSCHEEEVSVRIVSFSFYFYFYFILIFYFYVNYMLSMRVMNVELSGLTSSSLQNASQDKVNGYC